MNQLLRTYRRTIFLLCMGESCWGFQISLVAPTVVLSVLLSQLGASPVMIGSIFAIETGGMLLPQFLGIFLFRSNRNKQRRLVLWHVLFMIPFLFFMSAVIWSASWLGHGLSAWLLLLGFLGFQGAVGMVTAAWIEWFSQIIPREIRGTVLGLSWGLAALMGTVAGLWAGKLILNHPGLPIYALLYLIAGIMAMLSISVFIFIRYEEAADTGFEQMDFREMMSTFWISLKSREVQSFLIGRALMLAAQSVVPFIAVYYATRDGGMLSSGVIVSCGAAMAAGVALGNVTLGFLGDHWGHRMSLVVASLSHGMGLAMLLIFPGVWSCGMAYFLTGYGLAASGSPHNNVLLETSPHPHLLSHITAVNTALSPAAILFPLIAGKAVTYWGMRPIFLVTSLLGILAAIWLGSLGKRPLLKTG